MSDVMTFSKRTAAGLEEVLRTLLLDSENKVPADRLRIVGALADGAIIEQGSNANGEYVRFANGLQICMSTIALTGMNRTPDQSIWDAGQYTPPAAFVGTYHKIIVNATALNDDTDHQTYSIVGLVFSNGAPILYNTGASHYRENLGEGVRTGGTFNVVAITIQVVAIGKWK